MIIDFSDPINDWKLTEDEDGARSYTTEHVIRTDDDADGPPQIYADPLMPVTHDTRFPYDFYALCRRRHLVAWEDPKTWMVTIDWSTKQNFEVKEKNPYGRPVKGSIKSIDVVIPVFVDTFGNPCVNTAGDLYPGLTIVGNVESVAITGHYRDWPNFLRKLNNTVNANVVSLFGIEYPPRTLWLKNLVIPEEPSEEFRRWFWRTTYDVLIDYRGYWQVLPNSGGNAYVYQTRASSTAEFKDVAYSEYKDKTPTTDRRRVKRRILDSAGNDPASDTWLDRWGQETMPTFGTAPVGTASMSANSSTLIASVSVFTAESVGQVLTLAGPPPFDKPLELLVTEFQSATTVTVNKVALESFSGISLSVAGCLFNAFALQPQAIWPNTLKLPPKPEDLPLDPIFPY